MTTYKDRLFRTAVATKRAVENANADGAPQFGEIGPHAGVKSAYQMAAMALGISDRVVRDRCSPNGLLVRFGLSIDWVPDLPVNPPVQPLAQDAGAAMEAAENRAKQYREDELARLRAQLKTHHREALTEDVVREKLMGLAAEPLRPPSWSIQRTTAGKAREAIILPLSDLHWGEVVDLDAMGGRNSYNLKIAAARLRRYFMHICELGTEHWVGPPPAVIYLCLGGDLISGEIHEELAKTNDLLAIPAVRDLSDHLVAGIDLLLKTFDCDIRVISVPGNHGRCHEEHTEILTDCGWVVLRDVTGAEKFASVNLATGDARFVACDGVTRFSEDGAWRVYGHYRDELVAHDHRVVYRGGLVEADDLPTGLTAGDFDFPVRPEIIRHYEDDYVRLVGWAVFDGTIVDRRRYGETGFRVQWHMSKPRKLKELSALLDRMDIRYTTRLGKDGTTTICVYGEQARELHTAVTMTGRKGLPAEFAAMDASNLAALMETIVATDGRVVGTGGVEWSSVDQHNVDIVQALCAVHGRPMRVNLIKSPTSGYANRKPIHICRIQPGGMTGRSSCHKVVKEWVNGTMNFVGVTVPQGTVITRRNGKACVTGNTTRKPESKDFAVNSYDTLVMWMLERWYLARGETRLSFSAPRSGDALIAVNGWNVLLTHGDRIGSKGGQGFVGVAATAARGMKKLVQDYVAEGTIVDLIIIDHLHSAMELEEGFVNGSLVGPSEYSRAGRMRSKPASQWMLTVHPRRCPARRWLVDVGAPEEGSLYRERSMP